MLKVVKLIEQICLSVFLYLISYHLIMFVWGNQGLITYRKLLQVQQQMSVHYEALEKHQRELLARADYIRNDSRYITIEARGLGYYQKDDKLILVNTWAQAQPAPSPGNQLTPDMEAMQPYPFSGIWLYALFLGTCFWLIIRLLYFGQVGNMPKEFSLGHRSKFSREKFPKVLHAKTIRNNYWKNPHNHTGNFHSKQVADGSSLDSVYKSGILTVEPYFPNQDDNFCRRLDDQ